MAFVLSNTSGDVDFKKACTGRIQARGGVVTERLFDLYTQPTTSYPVGSIELRETSADLQGVFLLELGPHRLSAKTLFALAIGVPVLSGTFVEDAIAQVRPPVMIA
jgi:hypothetical protein